jgi:Ras-related protein Rap-1B
MSEVEMLREEITRIKDDEHVPIVIVGNKADLEESRAVPRQRAFSCSRQWNAPYYETSARTRGKASMFRRHQRFPQANPFQVNVEAVFIDICRQLLLREEKFRELEGRDEYQDEERDVGIMGLAKRKRRARTKRPDGHRCVIL